MVDRLGYRAKVGLLVPSFNASMQPELEAMRPVGVTNHVARIEIDDGPLSNNEEQASLVARIGGGVPAALRQVLAIDPRVVLHGISIPTFWDGPGGSRHLHAELERMAGVPVVIGALACEAALERLDRPRRLGVITPYQPNGDEAVASYFRTLGFDVRIVHSLRSLAHSAIAESSTKQIVDAFNKVYAAGVDAVLQVGTNIAAADLADEAERWLSVPVISINTAIYWQGLRQAGIADQFSGFGRLMRMF
jgi:maleate isomerase